MNGCPTCGPTGWRPNRPGAAQNKLIEAKKMAARDIKEAIESTKSANQLLADIQNAHGMSAGLDFIRLMRGEKPTSDVKLRAYFSKEDPVSRAWLMVLDAAMKGEKVCLP